ncbi:hypothetical protein ACTMUQ_28895 [Streptomyces sp. SD11]|uniref:hypothetical protein n=1 Tax=unclassified Streptomyces TaxID=2593676 RepID=UPI00200DE7BC|nr:hypothetical protein [Streptomyces sp. LRE541]UPZ30448.1 hypothetical protein MUK60_23285 [Streptomyces sp. LRE541]
MTQATEAITLGSKATDAYVDGEPTVVSLSEQFGDAVHRIDTAESLVTLEGPEEAANAALELTTSLHLWANVLQLALAIDSGDYVPASGETVGNPAEVEERKERTFQVSDEFIRICRRLLDV